MACVYKYKSIVFNSELELDDFILSNSKDLVDQIGDLAYQALSSSQQARLKSIQAVQELNKTLKNDLKNKNRDPFNYMYGDYVDVDKKYIAITKFLSGLKNIDGKLLFPEMIKENFFAERTKDWLIGRFTDRELENLKDILELSRDSNGKLLPPQHIDQNTIQDIKDALESMWDAEAKIGSAIHKCCQTFFSTFDKKDINHYVADDPYRTKGSILSPNDMVSEFDRWGRFGDGLHISDFLTHDQKLQIVEYCRKLQDSIESKWGSSSKNGPSFLYFPELTVSAQARNPETNESSPLIGVIDLLVVDPNGGCHIVDYKISPADYYNQTTKDTKIVDPDQYSSAKVLGFEYQLSTYARMLRTISGNFRRTSIAVAPIQLLNLNWDKDKKKWAFDSIELEKPTLETLLDKIDEVNRKNAVESNLDQIFEDADLKDVENSKIVSNVDAIMKKFLNGFSEEQGFSKTIKLYSEQDVAEIIGPQIQKTADDKSYMVTVNENIFMNKSKAGLIKDIQKYFNQQVTTVETYVERFIQQLKGDKNIFTSSIVENQGGSTEWYKDVVEKYAGTYERVEDVPESFKALGIVVMRNLASGNYEILTFTPRRLKKVYKLGNNKKLTGAFMDDIEDESRENYVLESKWGNIEILKTLAAILQTPNIFHGGKINAIQVVNPFLNSGLTATNDQILYTYKKLAEFSPIPQFIGKDYISSNDIKFTTLAERAIDTIETGFLKPHSTELFSIINKCLPEKEERYAMTIDRQKEVMKLLLKTMESGEGAQNVLRQINKYVDINALQVNADPGNVQNWYQAVLAGYTEAMGYHFTQQTEEYSNYVDSFNPEKGHSGLLLDNPGTTANRNVNLVSEFAENMYNRVATRLKNPTAKLQNLIRNLKAERGRSWLGDKFSTNPLSIYEGMTHRMLMINNKTGVVWNDWVFENPKNLHGAQKELAEYALLMFNYNRFNRGESLEEFKDKMNKELNKKKVDIKWLRVPLGYIGSQGVLESNGLMQGLRDYIKSWKLSEVKERFKDEFGHLYDEEGRENVKEIFRMRLIFDKGEDSEGRQEMLRDEKTGKDRTSYYDHDIERLLLKHLYSYILKDEFDEASYLMKAAIIDQHISEATQNDKRENSIEYITKLVKRMTGKRLMSEKESIVDMYVKKFMKGASVMALGFSPKQMYQALEGIYKTIGILIRKPDGTYGFTFSEMLAAFADVWKEIGHFGSRRSKLERINELFRLNDMDMNVYAEHLQDRHNIWHDTSTFLFRFASRPDFYNRLTIIEAYMRHDGVWDAYEVDEHNELQYYFDRDPRFNLLNTNSVNASEYNQQLGLYWSLAKQFEKEGAYNSDGTKFVGGQTNGKWNPLPQAYTNKEMNSFKSLTDQMYGYYSQEKKALIQSSLIGAMFFQMYTYFSGKKNQWLAPGSVKNQGRFLQYEDYVIKEETSPTGEKSMTRVKEKFYYQTDENGNPRFDLPPVPESQVKNGIKIPYYQWRGTFTQGVLTTLSRMLGDVLREDISEKGLLKTIQGVKNDYWDNPDENLRTAYRQNIRQFEYEMFVFLVIGGIIGSQIHRFINNYTGDHKDDHSVIQGFKNTAMMLFDNIFKASTLDFNVFDSLGGRGISWTPFSIDMWKRTVQNWSKVITGDRTVTDATLRTFAATKHFVVPLMETIKEAESRQRNKEAA